MGKKESLTPHHADTLIISADQLRDWLLQLVRAIDEGQDGPYDTVEDLLGDICDDAVAFYNGEKSP